MTTKSHGFTIIELIVVVIVIAVLTTIGIVTYNAIQKDSRVTAVKARVAAMQSGLEKYHANNGEYPALATIEAAGGGGDALGKLLNLPGDVITGNAAIAKTLVPCTTTGSSVCRGGNSVPNVNNIYFVSANNYNSGTSGNTWLLFNLSPGQCDLERSGTVDNTKQQPYVIVYYDEAQGKWLFVKSQSDMTSDYYWTTNSPADTCKFS